MSGFVLTKDQQDLKRLAADFGKKVMRPAAKEYDLKGETPLDIYRQAVKIGFTEVALPKEFGGLGLGCTTQCVLTEELSRWEAGIANALGATSLACKPILIAGNDAQKKYAVELVQAGDTITTVSTLVMGILALLISLQFTNLIPLLSLAYSLINAGALIMIVGGVFWKKATKEGAIASFIVGVGLTLLNSFKIIVIPYASVLPLLPALAVFIIVSLITQPKRAATTE